MGNTINYAQKWEKPILKAFAEGAFTGRFITNNVKWLDAKTFNFTTLKTSGFGDYSLTSGWASGGIVEGNKAYTLTHDRGIELPLDKREIDESGMTATVQAVTETFIAEHATPEMDAKFFADVTQYAIDNSLYVEETSTIANAYTHFKASFANIRRYRSTLVSFCSSEFMDLLERSSELTRKIEMTQVLSGGLGIETRITNIDGVDIIEVTDFERFYTKIHYVAKPAAGAVGFSGDIAESTPISYIFADTSRCITVPKIASIYTYSPETTNTTIDGPSYKNRTFWETFVFPDGHRGIKSIYVAFDSGTLEVTSVAGDTAGKSVITIDRAIADSTNYEAVYKEAETTAPSCAFGDDLTAWTALTLGTEQTLTTTYKITVAIRDKTTKKAITYGSGTITSAASGN